MPVSGVVLRHRVPDLEAAVPFCEQLVGATATRFAFSGAQLASVGPFLLFSAPGEIGDRLANVRATLTVDDLDTQHRDLLDAGAEIVAAPAGTPNGRRMIVRHPDGAVFEYVSR